MVIKYEQNYLTGFVCPSVRLSHMNYVEYLSAVKFNYQFSSTSDQAMSVCGAKKVH